MKAKIIHATIDPRGLPAAAEAVRLELGPQFLSHPGARHGYWMADRTTGHLLAVTLWDSEVLLQAASAVDAAQRAAVAERVGLRILSVHVLDVLGAHEEAMSADPHFRWVRATWVDGLVPGVHGRVPQLYREAVPDQARSRGFCASYWLADVATGSGLGLSLWEGPAELSASELNSRRRRRRFEELLGCKVNAVAEYHTLGVARPERPPAPADLGAGQLASSSGGNANSLGGVAHRDVAPPARAAEPSPTTAVVHELSQRAGLGTTIERPPGALLAVRGARNYQVVVLLDGRAAVVHHNDVLPMVRGANFGAHAVMESRAAAKTVLATSPVQMHVFSRMEFSALSTHLPSVARELVTHDLDC